MIGDSDPLLNGSNGGLTTVQVQVEPDPVPLVDYDYDSSDYGDASWQLGNEWGQFLSQPTGNEDEDFGGFEESVGEKQTLLVTSIPFTEQNNGGLLGHQNSNEAIKDLEMENSDQEGIENYLQPDEVAGNGEILDSVPVPVPVPGPSSSFVASQPYYRRVGKNQKSDSGNKVAAKEPKTPRKMKARTGTQYEAFVQTGSKKYLFAYKARQNREKKKLERKQLEALVASLQEENDRLKTQLGAQVADLQEENDRLKTQLNGNVQVQKNEYLEEENSFLKNRILILENENVGHKRDKNFLQAQLNGWEQENKRLHQRIQKIQQNNPPN